jgi:hypothetical protein
MKTKVIFRSGSGSNQSIYMVYRFTDGQWVPEQYFPHNERDKSIDFAKDLSGCEYGGDTTIWISE